MVKKKWTFECMPGFEGIQQKLEKPKTNTKTKLVRFDQRNLWVRLEDVSDSEADDVLELFEYMEAI